MSKVAFRPWEEGGARGCLDGFLVVVGHASGVLVVGVFWRKDEHVAWVRGGSRHRYQPSVGR